MLQPQRVPAVQQRRQTPADDDEPYDTVFDV